MSQNYRKSLTPSQLDEALSASQAASAQAEKKSLQPKRWASEELFGTDSEVEIVHNGAVYRLRQTSLGKLILNK